MTDTTIDLDQTQWSAKPLTEAQQKNRDSAALIPFTEGGMSPQNFAQVVDFAKHMAQAKGMLGPHLVGNYAGCLAIIELAQQFRMRPFMLARQTYFVNGMIAFDGQAIMSIMNLHMPLAKDEHGNKTRLMHRFEGEKAIWEPVEIDERDREDRPTGKKVWISKLIKPSTRQIILTGRMEKEATILEYKSPPVFLIKNKKSPLWEEDEDQQLIYWGSRRWQRRHWPEGMLGIIDREEAAAMYLGADNARLVEEKPGQALLERVRAAQMQTDDADAMTGVREGFSKDHAENESRLHGVDRNSKDHANNETNGHQIIAGEPPPSAGDGPGPAASDNQPADAVAPATEPEHEVMPRNPQEWSVYARAWIAASRDVKEMEKRWAGERKLRNDCGVTQETRDPVFEFYMERKDQIKSPTT